MTNERQIGQAMIEEGLSGRNGSALETHGGTPADRAAVRTARHAVARRVRRSTNTRVVCEVPA
ncbi:hypothetical protein EVC45_33805 [Paraburkholderia sp. UYCP14C]|nr:hypothetical protein EVC45_33805 [Paraburkholderia sp. UYCP14C]